MEKERDRKGERKKRDGGEGDSPSLWVSRCPEKLWGLQLCFLLVQVGWLILGLILGWLFVTSFSGCPVPTQYVSYLGTARYVGNHET